MELRFRTARTDDIPAIVSLVNLAYRVEDFFIDGNRTHEGEVGELLAADTFLVAEGDDGELIASVHVSIAGDRGYFGMLSVHPTLQGSGVGRRVVAAAETLARAYGCREMDLSYVHLRPELPVLYRKFGYRETGTAPFPHPWKLKQPAHLVTMSKPLHEENSDMAKSMALTTPLTDEAVDGLEIGTHVTFTGIIYTARDAAHKRLIELVQKGEELPIDLRGQVIYYVGPTPPRPGAVIGSAGPTTAMRLDPYTEPMLALGVKGIIGKGGRGPAVREAIAKHHAVYCIAVGGTGALLNRHIKSAEVVAFEDLGTEAIRRLEVEGFPAIVVNDCRGGDLLEAGKKEYRTSSRPIPAVRSLGG